MISTLTCIIAALIVFGVAHLTKGLNTFCFLVLKFLRYCPTFVQHEYDKMGQTICDKHSTIFYFNVYFWLAFPTNLTLGLVFAPLTDISLIIFCVLNAGVIVGLLQVRSIFGVLYEEQLRVGLIDFTDQQLYDMIDDLEKTYYATFPPEEADKLLRKDVDALIHELLNGPQKDDEDDET